MSDFEINMYPDPIQGGDEKVTRQRGLDPRERPAPARDVMADSPVIQGSPDIFTTRVVAPHQRLSPDGLTLYADHMAPGGTVYVDGALSGTGESNPPPAILIADQPISATEDAGWAGHPGVVQGIPPLQPTGDVIASDKPAPGQQVEGAPVIITPEAIAAAKAAKKAGR